VAPAERDLVRLTKTAKRKVAVARAGAATAAVPRPVRLATLCPVLSPAPHSN
jgi:hypothetical protein